VNYLNSKKDERISFLERVYVESKALRDSYYENIVDLSEKIANLIGFSLGSIVINTALLTTFLRGELIPFLTRIFLILGNVLLMITAVISVIAYKLRKVDLGPSIHELYNLTEKPMQEDKLLKKLIITYCNSSITIDSSLVDMQKKLRLSLIVFLSAICSLLISFIFLVIN